MNILDEARSVLEAAGYRTALAPASALTCYFEDQSVVGAVFVHESVSKMLAKWQESQDSFLGANSRPLRTDPMKAWNIYTIHLTADSGSGADATKAFTIEHDFRGTRKIARVGIASRAGVKEALLPLLGIQHRPTLSSRDLSQRLRERLALASPTLVRLVGAADEEVVAAELLEEP